MKRFVIHIFSLLAFLVFCSKSCESPEDQQAGKEEAELKATLDSISSSFFADQPSEQTLRLLEVKAKQKLADLADYLQIYYNETLDEAFRTNARQMIRDLFISDSVLISLKFTSGMNEKGVSLDDFLRDDKGFPGNTLQFSFDSIILSAPLHRINEISYMGVMSFIQRFQKSTTSDPEDTFSVIKEADIFALKVRKPFGSDTLKTWSVFLGGIR